MKKFYSTVALIMYFLIGNSYVVLAQYKLEQKDYPMVFGKVDSLIEAYVSASKFTPDYSGDGKIGDREINTFKALFKEDAMLADELCVKWFDGNMNIYNYEWIQGVNRSLNDYCQKRIENFKNGMDMVNITNANISYNNLRYGQVLVLLEKETSALFVEKDITITSKPILELDLQFNENFSIVRIAAIRFSALSDVSADNAAKSGRKFVPIENAIPGLMFSEDPDYDFYKGKNDFSPLPGLTASSNGVPSDKEKESLKRMGFTFESPLSFDVNGSAGVFLTNTTLATNGFTGYLDHERWLGNKELNPTLTNNISFGGQFLVNYYFGDKRSWGISSGLQWMYFSGSITAPEFKVTFKDSLVSPIKNELITYRRTVSSSNLEESYKATMLSIPVLAKYKFRLSNRLTLDIGAGVNINLNFIGSSNIDNAFIDYEGVFSNVGGKLEYQPDSNAVGARFFEINSNAPAAQTNYFLNEGGFGQFFGANVNPDAASSNLNFKLKANIALVFRPSLIYKVNSNFNLLFGLNYVNGALQAGNLQESRDFTLSTKKGAYNSMMNSFENIAYQSIFVNLGIRYSIIK
jgi:hypothetical protein